MVDNSLSANRKSKIPQLPLINYQEIPGSGGAGHYACIPRKTVKGEEKSK